MTLHFMSSSQQLGDPGKMQKLQNTVVSSTMYELTTHICTHRHKVLIILELKGTSEVTSPPHLNPHFADRKMGLLGNIHLVVIPELILVSQKFTVESVI